MLHEWFTDSVLKHPGETALVVAGRELDYAGLDAASRAVKRRLADEGADRPRVGLLATRSVAAYAAYLAVLRLGGVVVPLDRSHPAERLAQIGRTARLDFVVADLDQDTEFLADSEIRTLRFGPAEPGSLPDASEYDGIPDLAGAQDAHAYLLFTSGSTGRPKGVPIRHRNLDDYLRFNIERYRLGPGCRVSQTFHLAFDPSVFDMFTAWGSGAALIVPSADELHDPVAFVNTHRLTHWSSVPSLITMAQDAGMLPQGGMPSLRWSLFCGEQFTLAQARAWADAAPASTVENYYGPTETTVTVAAYRLPADRAEWPATSNATVPIGEVYPHLEHRVDPDDGELQIRGSQRFDGYHDPADNPGRFARSAATEDTSPALTSPAPDDWYRTGDRVAREAGALVHLGRLDQQIKFRGYRIELHEIEGALRIWTGVDDAVVLLIPRPDGTQELAALCTGEVQSLKQSRLLLRDHLPLYMIPQRVVPTPRLPLNDRGKVDRKACAELLRP